MRRLLLVLVILASVPACKGTRKAAKPAQPASCTADADCVNKWVCLAGKCTNPASGAIYTDPSNAVTPDKVKAQVEEVGAQHEADVDKSLNAQ